MKTRLFIVAVMTLVLLLEAACQKPPVQNQNLAASSTSQATFTQPDSNVPPTVSNSASADNAAQADSAPNDNAAQEPAPAKLVIPAGTAITVRLQQRLSSASSVPGERFVAVIDQPVVVGNQIVIPVGASVEGHVLAAHHSGRLRHPGELALTLDTVTIDQQIVRLTTSRVVARGGSHKKRNLAWIGGGTGGGALIGALAAGGKGALIGSGIGAVAGTTTAVFTGKKDVVFGNERLLRFRVNQDVSLFG